MYSINAKSMSGMLRQWIQGSLFWVYFTGVVLVVAYGSIITNRLVKEACLGLTVMLFIFISAHHIPGFRNQQTMPMTIVYIFSNITLAGAALPLAGIAACVLFFAVLMNGLWIGALYRLRLAR